MCGPAEEARSCFPTKMMWLHSYINSPTCCSSVHHSTLLLFLCSSVLHSVSSQVSSPSPSPAASAAYYGYTSYTGFSSAATLLNPGSTTSLSMRFRFCQEQGGVLLQALGGGGEYFIVGITRTQQLQVQFSSGAGEHPQVQYCCNFKMW